MGHTFVFVHGIVVALLSIVAATNGTIPIQSVPFTDVGVIKKEVSEAVPFDVRSEDRGLQKAWWKLIHANPEKVYKKLKLHITEQDIFKHPELEWFANYMQRYYVNQDSDLLLAKMVAKSHKDGSLMRYIEEAKVRYNTRDKTDEPEAATFIRNVERIEAGLHRYWELQRYTVKDLVDFFIQSGELSMENVKRASHFLFRKNLFTVLKAYAIKTNVEDPEKAVALAIADQVGLDNMALMIQEADNPLAIKTLTILYEDYESKKNMLSDVFYRLQLGSFELDKGTIFQCPQIFFLKGYAEYIAKNQDSNLLLIRVLVEHYGKEDAFRVIQKAVSKKSELASSLRNSLFQQWFDNKFRKTDEALRTETRFPIFKRDEAAKLDITLQQAFIKARPV